MKEKNLNTIINNTFKAVGFSHKIADPAGGRGTQLPFDGFSVLPNIPLYWESKILKHKIQAFNFKKIETHQEESLNLIKDLLPIAKCIYFLGIWKSRTYFYLFALDNDLINYLKSKNKKSILKKELEVLIEMDLYVMIKKKIFDENILMEKIITKNVWEKIFYE